MQRFWSNPEFVRHRRSELRRKRAVTAVTILLAVLFLGWLASWSSVQENVRLQHRYAKQYGKPTPEQLAAIDAAAPVTAAKLFYEPLIWGQLTIFTFWCLLVCAQSVSGERERKTWDFQRASQMTPLDLVVGKVFGEPIMAHFLLACTMPITLAAGIKSGISARHVVATIAMIALSGVVAALLGTWLSSLFESRSRGIGLIATLSIYFTIAFGWRLWDTTPYGFMVAISPVSGISELIGDPATRRSALLFGHDVSWWIVTVLLYLIVAIWFVLMLARNLKNDLDDFFLLSRLQSVILIAVANLVVFATYDPFLNLNAIQIAKSISGMAIVPLLAIGVMTLSPLERLKAWWRTVNGGGTWVLHEDGLPWTWIALSAALTYAFVCLELTSWRNKVGYDSRAYQLAALQMLTIAVYVGRDVLFVQWCRLTRLRAPTSKGLAFLLLYYSCSFVIAAIFSTSSERVANFLLGLLTPVSAIAVNPGDKNLMFPGIYAGIGLQLLVAIWLSVAIVRRLKGFTSVKATA